MASSYSSEPLTLHVHNLAQATSFYLAALAPLGYGYVSEVQHQTDTATSKAIGLGPAGSQRVDVFISQSLRDGISQLKNAHVVFPATSTIAVREFYAAALQAGGKPVARPDNLDSSDGMFASIISDIDGNRVEVCFAGDSQAVTAFDEQSTMVSTAQPKGQIQRETDAVNGGAVAESVASSETPKPARSAKPPHPLKSAISTAKSLAASEPVKTAMTAVAASPQASPRRSDSKSGTGRTSRRNSITSTPSINAGNKTVVGTLIGAAAGAALAYTMVRTKKDSAEQQDEHERRLRSIDAKAEARAHCRTVNRQQATGKVELADRDSGYGSGSQYSASPPLLAHRSATFPQPGNGEYSSRGRSSTRRYFDYSHRNMSPEQYHDPRPARRQSMGGSSSHSTVRPTQRSQSNGSGRERSSRRIEYHRGPPTPPPGPPSMPDPPPARSRRGSISNQAGAPSRKSSVKDKPPSSFPRAMGVEAAQQEAPKSERAPNSYHSTRSAQETRRPASDAKSASTVRRANSVKSHSSAKNPNFQESNRPIEPPRRPSAAASRVPPAPVEGPRPLTSKALSFRDRVEQQQQERGNKWDDLATIVPDDSISCASEREERHEKEMRPIQHPQRRNSRASRRSSYRDR